MLRQTNPLAAPSSFLPVLLLEVYSTGALGFERHRLEVAPHRTAPHRLRECRFFIDCGCCFEFMASAANNCFFCMNRFYALLKLVA